jgi:hypothetical protein
VLQSAYFTSPAKNIAEYVQRALNLADGQRALVCPYRFDSSHAPRIHPTQAVQVMYHNQAYICASIDKPYHTTCSRELRARIYQNVHTLQTLTHGALLPPHLLVLREVDAKAHALLCHFLGLCTDTAILQSALHLQACTIAIAALAFTLVGNTSCIPSILRAQTPQSRANSAQRHLQLIKTIQHDVIRVLDCDVHMATVWDILVCAVGALSSEDNQEFRVALQTIPLILMHDPEFATQYDSYSLVTMCLDCLLNLKYNRPLATPQPNWWYPPSSTTQVDGDIVMTEAGQLVGYTPLTLTVTKKIVEAVQRAVRDEGDQQMFTSLSVSYDAVAQQLRTMWDARHDVE